MTLEQLLRCGCCGCDFHRWPEYVDQDQDRGFGICFECQADAEERNDAWLDESAKLIEENLNPENAAKFRRMSVERRRLFAWKAHEDGMFTWSIGGHS